MTEVLDNTTLELQPAQSLPAQPLPESWYGMQAGTVLADRYRVVRFFASGGPGGSPALSRNSRWPSVRKADAQPSDASPPLSDSTLTATTV